MLDWLPSTRTVPQPSAGTANEYFDRLLPIATYLRVNEVEIIKEIGRNAISASARK